MLGLIIVELVLECVMVNHLRIKIRLFRLTMLELILDYLRVNHVKVRVRLC